jgi:hypothetical protein
MESSPLKGRGKKKKIHREGHSMGKERDLEDFDMTDVASGGETLKN